MTFGIKVPKKWIYLMYDKLSLYWSFDRSHWLNTAFCVCLRVFHLSIWEIISWLGDYPDWLCYPLKSAKGCKPVYMYSIHSALSWFKLFERFLMNRKLNSKMFFYHQKQKKESQIRPNMCSFIYFYFLNIRKRGNAYLMYSQRWRLGWRNISYASPIIQSF